MRNPGPSPVPPRLPRSAPAQNAGGAPVTTIAPTFSSALDLVHRRDDLVDHREGERVPAVGIVEGEGRDTISDVDMHEGHAGSLSPTASAWRPTARASRPTLTAMSDRRRESSDPPHIDADAVARKTFSSSFRGYDTDEVRAFLLALAEEIRAINEHASWLQVQLADAEERATAHVELDEDRLTALLGEETTRVLGTGTRGGGGDRQPSRVRRGASAQPGDRSRRTRCGQRR